MADLEELLRKQADASRFAAQMAEEKDAARLLEMAGQLQTRCAELGRIAQALAGPQAAAAGPETRVVLTPAQRERVTEQTGVGIEVVTLRDTPERQWSTRMPAADPREIEAAAAAQAAAARLRAETRAQVEQIVRELEELQIPELEETIAGLRRELE